MAVPEEQTGVLNERINSFEALKPPFELCGVKQVVSVLNSMS
jgi:hypothetical protein